jgi:hypothetical protein
MQNPTRCLFNLAGICQPALFYLQSTPLSQSLILAGFQATQFHGEKAALVPGIDHSQRAADICDQNQKQNQYL